MEALYVFYGAGLGLALTVLLASLIGFGVPRQTGGGYGWGFAIAFRTVVEMVLIIGFIAALIGVALVGTATAWSLIAGYAGVRAVSLVLESFASRQ